VFISCVYSELLRISQNSTSHFFNTDFCPKTDWNNRKNLSDKIRSLERSSHTILG
jgi:hypothetical protein